MDNNGEKIMKPQLVYKTSDHSGKPVGTPVAVGDIVKGIHNSPPDLEYEVTYFREPSSPNSSGKVSIQPKGKAFASEVYVSLIGAEWINRLDRD